MEDNFKKQKTTNYFSIHASTLHKKADFLHRGWKTYQKSPFEIQNDLHNFIFNIIAHE